MALSKITNLSITDDAVRTVGIQDDNVTLAKLGDGTQGDILYYGASGAPARLGFGTSGDFLKTQGTGANPVWATAGAGKLLAWKTVSLAPTAVTIDSTTWTDSNILIAVTPSSTDSRLLIMANVYTSNSSGTGKSYGLKEAISGGATTEQIGDATDGFFYEYNFYHSSTAMERNINFDVVHHPNTTSECTYTFNGRRDDYSGTCATMGSLLRPSRLLVFEIDGAAGL